jgi:hypothetical protein
MMIGITMKRFKLIFFVFLLLFLLNSTFSQQISGRFSTSFYSWERYKTEKFSDVITRLYQNIQLDAAHNQFSFHTNLNGAIGSASSLSDDGQVRVNNAFLRWKNIADIFDFNVGRVPVFAGVGNGIVDGLLLKAKGWNDKIIFTGYGGANVAQNLKSKAFDAFDKNFFVGGQIIGYLFEGARIGVSYTNRNRALKSYATLRPDSLLVNIPSATRKEQLLGADASFNYATSLSTYGRFDYDLNSNHVLRGEVNARINTTRQLALTGTYIYREPRIPYHSFFSVFEFESTNEYEGGVEYSISPTLAAYGRVAFVQYDEDMSRRLTIGLNTSYGGVRYSGSNGYSGQLASFSADCMYPMFERKLTPTIGVSFGTYRLDGAGKREEVFSSSLGAIIRLMTSFSLDAQIQWSKNKIAENDVRIFGKISYWFSHNFSQSQIKGEGE